MGAADDSDVRVRAAEAQRRRDWPAVYRLYSETPEAELDAAALDEFADAAWAVGDMAVSERARVEAHRRYLDAGDLAGAAWTALFVAGDALMRGDLAVAAGWRETAVGLLEQTPECRAHARLLYGAAFQRVTAGDFDAAVDLAAQCREVAARVGSRDLETLALNVEGRARAKRGELDTGMGMLDRAMAAALGSGLAPWAAMWIFCFTITTCQDLGDHKRAAEWTEATDRMAVSSGMNFSADCHIHRACVLKLRGSWARAEAEALQGCTHPVYSASFQWHAGWGWCEIGEVRMRSGDLDGAEEAFTAALAKGYPPHPGLALLRLAQGHVELAREAIERALAESPDDPALRLRLLEAAVTVRVQADDIDGATEAASELARIATTVPTPAFQAGAARGAGLVALARGEASAAGEHLRRAVELWLQQSMPYEAALARVELARAHQRLGDLQQARFELEAARKALGDLGALLDERHATALLAELEMDMPQPAAGVPVEKAFMFTDIERSTALAEAMGASAWDKVLRWHDRLLWDCIRAHGGKVVKHEGDGVFACFERESGAVDAAVEIQRRLDEHRHAHGFAPRVRIGIHHGAATERHGDYFGMAVNTAARIMALAEGGEIAATESTATAADTPSTNTREVEVKGITDPLRVVRIG